MDLSLLQTLLDWIGSHPYWSGLLIFLIAFSESLALVGLIVPGAVLMFGLGTLVTTGHLEFATSCLWAVLGAVAGDGVSYWIGYHFRDRIKTLWPLSRHPQLILRGTEFFLRHGGKSILFGRFVGPLRPIIPAIAGMYGMPLGRFLVVNIISGLAWAPLYLLPGMVFGLSLTLAGEVAGRLVVMVLALLVSVLLLSWLFRQVYRLVLPHVDKLLFHLANWSYRHPVAGRVPAALVRPDHPEVRMLSLLALLLFLASGLFIALSRLANEQSLLNQLDKLLQHNLHLLQTPWMVQLMGWFGSWGSVASVFVVTLLTVLWLLRQKNRLAVWHLSGAFAFPLFIQFGLPLLFQRPEGLTFPSATVTLATAVYGFIAVALARELPQRRHLLVYVSTAILLFLIASAQLYLRRDGLSHILAAFLLGCVWLAVLGIAYRRHVQHAYIGHHALRSIGLAYVLALLTSGLLVPPVSMPSKAMHAQVMSYASWQAQGWQELPLYREDLRNQHHYPFNLQWAASREAIHAQLQHIGWQPPLRARGARLLQWLNPRAEAQDLPVLPQVHDGDYDVIRFVDYRQSTPLILRLWKSNHVVNKGKESRPLWVGSIASLQQHKLMGLTFWRTGTDFHQAQHSFLQQLHEGKTAARVQLVDVPGAEPRQLILLDEL